jgi:uncharacterized protein (TIGR03663 family)
MKSRAGAGLLLIAAVALLLRGGDLASRPLHNDEAINAHLLERLWRLGVYHYDPHEYHGPALYYFSLPVVAAASVFDPDQPEVVSMRTVTVLFGVGLILLLALVPDAAGWRPVLGAAVLLALSPAMVFYSRYYIHELLLVFFTFLGMAALWRYSRRPAWGWAVTFGAAIGLMYATKETFVFALGAAGVAWLVMALTEPSSGEAADDAEPGNRPRDRRGRVGEACRRLRVALGGVRVSDGVLALVAAVTVWVVLYSSFFTNGAGPIDALRSYGIWVRRAGGDSPHTHPWHFYMERLGWFQVRGGPLWSEGAVLALGAMGGWSLWRGWGWTAGARRCGRFLAVYAVVLAGIYSAVPYKTPWCLLGFYHAILLLAGAGIWALWRMAPGVWVQGVVVIVGVGAAFHLASQSWRATHRYAADFRNPYVYGHTSADVFNLLAQVEDLARVHPDGRGMPLQVAVPGGGYWPLPWYWRHFEHAGWWERLPDEVLTPVVVVASSLGMNLEERSGGRWVLAGMFELRPAVFVELYAQKPLWDAFLKARRAARASGGVSLGG